MYMFFFHQVDPDFLKALPPEIRKELETDMKSMQKKKADSASVSSLRNTRSSSNSSDTIPTHTKSMKKFSISDAFGKPSQTIQNDADKKSADSKSGENITNMNGNSHEKSKKSVSGSETSQKPMRSSHVIDEQQPGCSHWMPQTLEEEALQYLDELDEQSNDATDVQWFSHDNGEVEMEMEPSGDAVDLVRWEHECTENDRDAEMKYDEVTQEDIKHADDRIVALPAFSQVIIITMYQAER